MGDDSRARLDGSGAALMVLLCAIWGMQQVALKAAAPDIAPIMQVGLRSGASALLLGLFMRWRGLGFDWRDGTLAPGLLAGALFAGEFLFVAEGLRYTTASHMAVFLYTAPIFTALTLHARLPAERLGPGQWLGIGLAFCGIALSFSGKAGPRGELVLLGDFLGILAGASWGFTTVLVRCSSLSRAPASKTLLYQLLAGFVLLLAYAGLSGQAAQVRMTQIAWASLAYQAVVVSFASYLAWFWLLTRYLATRLSVFSFLSPVFGVLFGVVLLGESVSPAFLGGSALVLSGVALVSLARR